MKNDRPIIFSPFRLDVANQRLYRGKELVSLRPKSFAVLHHLLVHSGRVLTKDELLDAIWPETAVSDTVLKVCIRELREALGDDPRTPRFIETAHRSGYCFIAEVRTDNLPVHLTSFIGREREVKEIKRLFNDTRLLTLVGVGGAGKTRLAARAARELDGFEDGVWWVDLAVLSNASLVPQTVAAALGVREQPGRTCTETLMEHVRRKSLCLVLDNCEHLVEACAALSDELLRAGSSLKILATSRETLSVAGEVVWPVPPLALPDSQAYPAVEELERYEAVRLFVERARGAAPGFLLNEHNSRAVTEVCRRLDGIPLAIELAAPRVKVLSVDQINSRLDDCFKLLAAGSRTEDVRHKTLRTTIDWSYDLLPHKEQTLLARLSVFAGGWTLEAGESVLAGSGISEGEILELTGHLVDKSLVVAELEGGGRSRYRLLETVRQYAREKLAGRNETESVGERHALFFLKLVEEIAPSVNSAERASALTCLNTEYDNIRVAMRRAEEKNDVKTSLRLCGLLFWFWLHSGYWSEGRTWLRGPLTSLGGRSRTRERAAALNGEGVLAWAMGDHVVARSSLEEAASIFCEVRDDLGLAHVLHFLAVEMVGQGEHARARETAERSVQIFRRGTDSFGLAVSLASLGIVTLDQGDYAAARCYLEESVSTCHEIKDNWALSLPLRNLGVAAFRQGDYDRAADYLRESIVVQREQGEKWFVSRSVETLAEVLALRGEHERAARLFGAGEALREAVGASVLPLYRADYDRGLACLRAHLDDAQLNVLWSEGRSMKAEQAVAYALAE